MEPSIQYLNWDEPVDAGCRHGALTIGNFDGVHRGHQALLAELVRQARQVNGRAVVLTFDPHPVMLLRPDRCPPLLTTVAQRIELLQRHGAETVLVLCTASEMLKLSARDFFDRVIRDHVQPRVIVPGFNFAFGHNREGTAEKLAAFCHDTGIRAVQVPPMRLDGAAISSSRVRATLGDGDVRVAAQMLGRPYALTGMVGQGAQRGQQLGFPTANLYDIPTMIPANGVYAVRVRLDEHTWPGAVNIGPNPTFGEDVRKVEVHLIGFSGDLYGRMLVLEFVDRLRETRPFTSAQELAEQLKKDIEVARQRAALPS
jgi:riboflavin kinase/FMN adenylyltransferase